MRGRTITVLERGATAVLRGWRVAEIARHAGLKPIYSGAAQGWLIDASRVGDFLAHCQRRHVAVDVERSPSSWSPSDQLDPGDGDRPDQGDDGQLGLFDGGDAA